MGHNYGLQPRLFCFLLWWQIFVPQSLPETWYYHIQSQGIMWSSYYPLAFPSEAWLWDLLLSLSLIKPKFNGSTRFVHHPPVSKQPNLPCWGDTKQTLIEWVWQQNHCCPNAEPWTLVAGVSMCSTAAGECLQIGLWCSWVWFGHFWRFAHCCLIFRG